MYSDSGADGGSLFGGGGFMPSQSAGLNDNSFSPGGGSKKGGSQSSGLIPLTVKQLSSASQKPSDDNFYVDGQEVNNITLVGMVFNKEEKVTDVSFILDDFTGRIEVKKWIDGQDSEELVELRNIRNGIYVRIYGHLRSFQGKRNVVAFSVRPIKEFDEVTFHFVEAIYVHAFNMKTQGGLAGSRTPASTAVPYSGHPASSMTPNPSVNMRTNLANQYMAPASVPVGSNSVDECQRRVHALFDEPANLAIEQGLHVDDVARKMVGYSKQQVKDAIEFLVNEGFIYSTIDDDHFKSTNG
ncbi:replication factor A2 [Marchantia polymorpha subsp. ruderalis]|nr:hypothetical protein MARPO_0166s0018 [Marchantia polymorpha]BBN12706.1 hypothetical protein Mp_5g22240 [Marchantia polymorpha subsp. ruderalis]|eukprot:PTQ28362.1 hypothetical protein MARPO_0166s0018 [Marchantia polymorpha]